MAHERGAVAELAHGDRIRTTARVYIDEKRGFLPPATDGEALFAVADNMFRCSFPLPNEENVTVTLNVPLGSFIKL